MTKPTPRPWYEKSSLLYDGDGGLVADMTRTPPEKRRLIVTAVNCHDELVDTLDMLVKVIERRLQGKRPHSNDIEWVKDTGEQARTVLARIRSQETT